MGQHRMLGYEPRYRFTLAEELSHFLLVEEIFQGRTEAQVAKEIDLFSDTEYNDFERNAKFLAGAILMPADRFKERFRALESIFSEELGARTMILSEAIRALSVEFWFSREAAGFRAKHLELVREEDLMIKKDHSKNRSTQSPAPRGSPRVWASAISWRSCWRPGFIRQQECGP